MIKYSWIPNCNIEQIVARVKSELSIFEQLELSEFPLRSEDILKWFKNVKLVTRELEQNIPDDYVADIEKLTKKIQLNIRLSWRDYGDILCCIAPYITHIVFNNDTSDFDRLSQIPRLQSIRVRADAGTVDICDWLPLKEPPIDVEVEVYTCDVEVFEEMASGDRGPKITAVYGKSITELELGRLVEYMKTSCPNIRNLGLSLDGVQNLFVPTLNMEQFVDFFKQLGQKLLDLYVYADIDLVVLDAILEHCSNLRSLQISHVCLDNKRDHRPIIAKLMRMLKVDDPCIVLKKYMVSSNSSNPQDFICVLL
ncbi:hypothetical protein HDE_00912 [Halotydeus destructor]|nr:hypothetical protein HDE_00912 [Halotydeus destructor]